MTALVSQPASSLENEYNDTIGVFTRYLALHNLMTIASAVLAAVSVHKYQKKLKLHKVTIRSPSPLKASRRILRLVFLVTNVGL